METEEEEASRRPSPRQEDDSQDVREATEEGGSVEQKCEAELVELPHVGQGGEPPSPAYSGDDVKDVVRGGVSEEAASKMNLPGALEEEKVSDAVPESLEVVVLAVESEVNDRADFVEKDESEIVDFPVKDLETEVADFAQDTVAEGVPNEAAKENVEHSGAGKAEETDKVDVIDEADTQVDFDAVDQPVAFDTPEGVATAEIAEVETEGAQEEFENEKKSHTLEEDDRAVDMDEAEEVNAEDKIGETAEAKEQVDGIGMGSDASVCRSVETEVGDRETMPDEAEDVAGESAVADGTTEVECRADKMEVMEEANVAGMVEESAKAERDGMENDTSGIKSVETEVIDRDTVQEELEEEAAGRGVVDETIEEEGRPGRIEGVEEASVALMEEDSAEGDGTGAVEEALEAEETETDIMEEDADVADATEEITQGEENETAEEQTTGTSNGKRKRGRNSKAPARVPAKKKMEEDVCFICFDGGELVLCDRRGCPKAYHPSCVNRDEAFFRAKGRWNCGWHLCSNCEKNAHYMCYTCTFSLCKACIKDAVILCVRGNKGFCETCMRTVMLIEQKEQENKDMGQVDFDDRSSWEYLFKDYWIDLKERLSLTYEELSHARNPWKGTDMLGSKQESSPTGLYDANIDGGLDSDNSSENIEISNSKRKKARKRLKSRLKDGDSQSKAMSVSAEGPSMDDSTAWASKELLEFVMHMKNGDKSILSQFDVQALLLDYIKRNKLRDPRRKSQIVCDSRLQNLFGKPRVGHFEMLKLLESHFLIKEDSQAEDVQGSVVDTEANQWEGDGNIDYLGKAGKDKKRKTRRKGENRGPQSNVDDYAAIDMHNVNLIYLRRNLVEELLEDAEKFHENVVGAFVRIRISGSVQKQDLYRLVHVVGTLKAPEPYKVGKRMTDIMLEILNLSNKEAISIDIISNQEFTEDECKRLRQSIKCGLINRLTVGDIQEKAMALQAVRVKDLLESEIVRLSHLRDRASEKGRRKELRECVEKLQILKMPEERQRRLEEIPEIHADPKMDPSYESEEDEEEMDDKRQDNSMRPRGMGFSRRGREPVSPGRGVSNLSDSWSGTRNNYTNMHREFGKSLYGKGFFDKGDDVTAVSEMSSDISWHHEKDRESQRSNSREKQKLSAGSETNARNSQPVVMAELASPAAAETSAMPHTTGTAQPAFKINESEKIWHYQDPSGKVQGPFSMVQLRKWSNTGYFPANLMIWRSTEKQDDSILLTDALAGKFQKEPSVLVGSPMAPMGHDSHQSSSYSGKPHVLPVPGMGAQVGERSLDKSGGSLRCTDNISTLMGMHTPSVELPKSSADGWVPDYGGRKGSTNLPSPTPQTTPIVNKGLAFESRWSSPSDGSSLYENRFPGQPAPALKGSQNGISSSHHGAGSTPMSGMGATGSSQVTAAAPILAEALSNQVFNVNVLSSNLQNLVQSLGGQNSHVEAQGWRSGLVPKPETAAPVQMGAVEPQAWGGTPTQRLEPNNPSMPGHGHGSDALSSQNSSMHDSGNVARNISTPGFSGVNAETWRPAAAGNLSNIQPQTPSNLSWGMGGENQNAGWASRQGNQNMSWAGPAPANPNINWASGQGPAPGNVNLGWVAPSQGPSPVSTFPGWATPGQGNVPVNANPSWVAPSQGPPAGNANLGWGAPSGNPGMWGGDQSYNVDRFSNQGDRSHGGDSGYGGGKNWNRQSSFGGGGGGGSSRAPFKGQRVCKFHENGHCKKGASCDYLHT